MSQALQKYGANKNMAALGAMLSFLQANPQIRSNVLSAGRTIAGQAANALGFPSGNAQTSSGLVSISSKGASRRKTKTRSRRSRKTKAMSNMSAPRGLSYTPRMKFKFIIPITTDGTTGIRNTTFWPGYDDTNMGYSMKSVSSQYNSIATIFRYQDFHTIDIEYEPLAAYSTSGWAGAQVYPDPTVTSGTVITTAQLYTQRQSNFLTDVKERKALKWVPADEQQSESKEIADASAVVGAPRRNYSPGVIFLGATTNLTSAATLVGHFIITVDITFSGLV